MHDGENIHNADIHLSSETFQMIYEIIDPHYGFGVCAEVCYNQTLHRVARSSRIGHKSASFHHTSHVELCVKLRLVLLGRLENENR